MPCADLQKPKGMHMAKHEGAGVRELAWTAISAAFCCAARTMLLCSLLRLGRDWGADPIRWPDDLNSCSAIFCAISAFWRAEASILSSCTATNHNSCSDAIHPFVDFEHQIDSVSFKSVTPGMNPGLASVRPSFHLHWFAKAKEPTPVKP